MVVIDTDVFTLAFAFHRDPRQKANSRFLDEVQSRAPAIVIYSVMELLGQLAFNLSAQQLSQWNSWLQDRFRLTVLYPQTEGLPAPQFFQREFVVRPLQRMSRQPIPYVDGLILGVAEQVQDAEAFVTWNKRHYQGKTPLPVLTPADFIQL